MTDFCTIPVVEAPVPILGDYYMPVGDTGIMFVAWVPGYRRAWGIQFPATSTEPSKLRAASTMAHMGMVRGVTFRFMREGAKLTTTQAASIVGVTVSDIDVWEEETLEIPRDTWQHLAEYVAHLDGKIGLVEMQLPHPDYRPRQIRVYPDLIQVSGQPADSGEGGDDCSCPC